MPIRSVFALVEEIKRHIENLSVDDLRAELDNNADLLLVDIREKQERTLGTIAGAKHAPRGLLEFWADPSSPHHRSWFREDRRIVLFCAVGGRSALAAKTLGDMGFVNVAHLAAGFVGWRDAGQPVRQTPGRWLLRH